MTRLHSNACPMFVCAVGRASGLKSYPPALRLLAHLFSPERRISVAICAPVVRVIAAGFARSVRCVRGRTTHQTRLQNQSRVPVICGRHPRLYRRRGQVCGVQIRSEPQSRQQLPGKSRADRSNRLKAVRVVPFVFVALLLHAHNKSMEKQACRTQNLGSSNP